MKAAAAAGVVRILAYAAIGATLVKALRAADAWLERDRAQTARFLELVDDDPNPRGRDALAH